MAISVGSLNGTRRRPPLDDRPVYEPQLSIERLGPVLLPLSSIKPVAVRWLWPNRIAMGRVTVFAGPPGLGKSFTTVDIASRVSTGTLWPDGSGCAPMGDVLFISAEDDPADTIRPRFDASGADANRIQLMTAIRKRNSVGKIEQHFFTLQHLAELREAARQMPALKLIVVDPIGSFLGRKIDSNKDAEVRSVLAPAAQVAAEHDAALLLVAHTRKGIGGSADEMVMGSRAFTGLARAVWHVSKDREHPRRRLLLSGKNNLAAETNGLAFTIEGVQPSVVWEREPVEMSADEAMAEAADRPGPAPVAVVDAARWLKNLLSDYADHPVAEIRRAAEQAGHKWRTVQRARKAMNVQTHRQGRYGGGSVWRAIKPTGVE